jgi:hypothetical protein
VISRKLAAHGAFGLLLCSLSMCTSEGTETDNPVFDFDATECKNGHSTALSLPVTRTRAALSVDPSAYEGLYCYAWENGVDDVLTIDVINYGGGCSVTWNLGKSRVTDDRIDLGVQNAYCEIAACGSCTYDLAFEVGGVDTTVPADVQLREVGCGGADDQLEPRIELPVDVSDTGIVCRLQRYFEDECGRAHLPSCSGDGGASGSCEGGCDEGLVCVIDETHGFERELCFTQCEQDEDCPLEIETCQTGACRLRETF